MRGIPVWSHCYGPATDSIKAGVDLIIHGFVLSDEEIYKKCFNRSDLEQSVLSDLLSEGLIY